MPTKDEVMKALSKVIDPEISISITDLGLIYDVEVDGGKANRYKDIGTIGIGNYTVYMKFKGDVWDGTGGIATSGIRLIIVAATYDIYCLRGNQVD